MKGLLRQLQQATGVASPGLVNRLLASANAGADCNPVALLTDSRGARRMATGAEIMCESNSPKQAQENKTNAAKPSVVSMDRATRAATVPVEEAKVVAMPAASAKGPKWWRPDPATGTWVPEGSEGQVVTKSPSRVTRIRSDSTASLEDRRWWTSMEELPDMDRAKPKASVFQEGTTID